MVGGAVKRPLVVDEYLSQMDLAATLLAQLHIPYDDFTFSKNLTDSTKEHFVFMLFPMGSDLSIKMERQYMIVRLNRF